MLARRFQREPATSIVLLGESRGELGGSEYLEAGARAGARACRPRSISTRERALQRLLVALADGAADSLGARLLGRRPRGRARRVLLRHRRLGAEVVDLTAVDAPARRTMSRDAVRRSRRRASSCRRAASIVDRGARQAAARGRAGARDRRDRRQPLASRIGGRRLIDRRGSRWRVERRAERIVARHGDSTTGGLTPRTWPDMLDKFNDECGVFGIFGHPEAANLTYLGLYALQHRGQESAGIAASDGTHDPRVARRWATSPTSSTATTLAQLPGTMRHRPRPLLDGRREPAGERAADPRSTARTARSPSATTATSSTPTSCATSSCSQGSIFQTTSDTEVMLHLYARSQARTRRGRHRRVAVAGRRARSRS